MFARVAVTRARETSIEGYGAIPQSFEQVLALHGPTTVSLADKAALALGAVKEPLDP